MAVSVSGSFFSIGRLKSQKMAKIMLRNEKYVEAMRKEQLRRGIEMRIFQCFALIGVGHARLFTSY